MFDHFDEAERFRKEMDEVIDRFVKRTTEIKNTNLDIVKGSSSEVKVKDNEIHITIALPGVDKKDIVLNIAETYVEIKARKRRELNVKKRGFYKFEKSFSGMHKVIPFSNPVDLNSVKAEYKNNVLKIRAKIKDKTKEKIKKVSVQ